MFSSIVFRLAISNFDLVSSYSCPVIQQFIIPPKTILRMVITAFPRTQLRLLYMEHQLSVLIQLVTASGNTTVTSRTSMVPAIITRNLGYMGEMLAATLSNINAFENAAYPHTPRLTWHVGRYEASVNHPSLWEMLKNRKHGWHELNRHRHILR